MVGAGAVTHPSELEMGGYNQILNPPKRYGLIDVHYFWEFCGFLKQEHFAEQYRRWVQEALDNGNNLREDWWTESIAVGGFRFVEETKARLGTKGIGRKVEGQEAGRFVLKEEVEAYNADSIPKNSRLSPENSFSWNIFCAESLT